MMLKNLPVENPKPDVKHFIDFLMGRTRDGRVPLVEYIVDDVLMRPIVRDLLGRSWVPEQADRGSQTAFLDNFIAFWQSLGYDFVRYERSLPFPMHQTVSADPVAGSDKERAWADQHEGTICTWDDFERYPWPKVEEYDFFGYEYLNSHLPEGMGLMVCHAAGVFEHLSQIMSYEGLCIALLEQPDLVQAMSERIGGLMERFYAHLLDFERVIAIFPGDDMGFRSSTLVSPEHLRAYVLPWHKRFAAMTHARGLPYFIHSCGNLSGIMEDLIEDVKIDGKHSYEDAIMPVEDFQAKYGSRIAVMGGIDINRLTLGTEEQVRRRARDLIETCGGRGRYAIGSGNSIPSYIPLNNYLAMVDEALS
jgi:uroporphyrinogen decarboxylase